MKKSILSVFFAFLLVIFSCISAAAASFIPYQGLTDSSSQASLLYGYYRNLDSFSYDNEFIIMRSGQYEYYLFYAEDLSSDSVNYISYTGTTSSGYNTVWSVSVGVENNFSYVLNEYSVVGNIPGTVSYSDHYSGFIDLTIQIAAYAFLLFFIFFIFRSHVKELSS